jgi:uncharacterized cupin superfamily protein
MKTYLAKFNPKVNGGVYAISLVENPAMEGLFIALSKDEQAIQLKEIDKEKRILMGLVLEPNKPIYRNQNGEEFNIVFDEQTIEELSHSFFKLGYQNNSTIEHDNDKQIKGVTFVESWIVEDSKIDKSANFGFSYPKGSWLATMKVDSDEVWENYVKTGKVQGFSVDAFLSLEEVNLKSNINMSKQEEGSLLQLLKDLPTQIATALGLKQTEIKLGSIMTEDGELKIEFDGEVMMVGGRVWVTAEDGTEVPVPVGDHVLENGNTMVVKEEGIVDSFIEPQAETETEVEVEVPAEMATPEAGKVSNDEKIASEIESAIKSILIKYSEQSKEIETLKEQVLELGKQPSSKGIKQTENTSVVLTKKERLLQTIKGLN